jgi:uncharacterized protein
MTRLLFWIALAVLIVMAVRAKLRQMSPKPPASSRAPRQAPADASEKMACCAACGLYFPASEAVHADGRDYCCPAHVRQPPR